MSRRRPNTGSRAYDLVLNGVELGSGSIRIHRRDIQALVFKSLGFTEEDARHRFGFFMDAPNGTPPHGGFAVGLDRLIMLLAGKTTIRDVIPVPQERPRRRHHVRRPEHRPDQTTHRARHRVAETGALKGSR